MPGIIGAIARTPEVLVGHFERAMPTLPKPLHAAAIDQPMVRFQAATNDNGPERITCRKGGALSVLIYGHCFDASSGKKLDSGDLLDRYRGNGLNFLDTLEGAFHIVICDRERQHLMVINDRLGILPLYWTGDDEKIIFSHKLKHLGLFTEKDIDEKGLLTFLISGYCYLDRTLFKGVRYLTPASILTVDLESMKTTHQRYWNLVYRANSNANPRDLCRRLDNAITESVELFTPDGSHRRAGVFLSGGWDSKGILGTMIPSKPATSLRGYKRRKRPPALFRHLHCPANL